MVFHQCVFERDFLGHILLDNIKLVGIIAQKKRLNTLRNTHVIQYLSQTFFHIPGDRICKAYPQCVIVHAPFQKKKITLPLPNNNDQIIRALPEKKLTKTTILALILLTVIKHYF